MWKGLEKFRGKLIWNLLWLCYVLSLYYSLWVQPLMAVVVFFAQALKSLQARPSAPAYHSPQENHVLCTRCPRCGQHRWTLLWLSEQMAGTPCTTHVLLSQKHSFVQVISTRWAPSVFTHCTVALLRPPNHTCVIAHEPLRKQSTLRQPYFTPTLGVKTGFPLE